MQFWPYQQLLSCVSFRLGPQEEEGVISANSRNINRKYRHMALGSWPVVTRQIFIDIALEGAR